MIAITEFAWWFWAYYTGISGLFFFDFTILPTWLFHGAVYLIFAILPDGNLWSGITQAPTQYVKPYTRKIKHY